MANIVWAGELGLVYALGPVDLDDVSSTLPESVEAQTRRTFANLDALLDAASLTRAHVLGVTIHLTQFPRFHVRMHKALSGCWSEGAALSVVGVSHLPRDALIQVDVLVTRQARDVGIDVTRQSRA